MVSGRDDHGLVAVRNIALRSAPDGGGVAGRLPDGTLAPVREVRGTQVQVSGSGVTGWVDDFVLRGELRLA
ncbi:MAG: SH3 domain-containing protein [Dermatophilaceae bacterium]